MAEKKPLILVVDDEANFREIFSTKLTMAGFRTEMAENGKQAIEKARRDRPDIVLMDVKMPEMDGIEAFMRLKEDADTDSIKVLFLTNLGDPRADIQEINRRLSKEMGAVGYFKKTDDLDLLIERIKNLVQ